MTDDGKHSYWGTWTGKPPEEIHDEVLDEAANEAEDVANELRRGGWPLSANGALVVAARIRVKKKGDR